MLKVIKTLKTQDHIPAKQYRDLLPEKIQKGEKQDRQDIKYFNNFTNEKLFGNWLLKCVLFFLKAILYFQHLTQKLYGANPPSK